MTTKKENRGGPRANSGGARKGAGRKRVLQHPVTKVQVKLGADQLAKLDAVADAEGLTRSDILRAFVDAIKVPS